jgi:hypothetical protein
MSFPPGTEMFQFPGFAPPAYRFGRRYPIAGVGCPIRRSPDRSPLAAPRGLSQRATSFVASWRQGIHQVPFLSLDPAQRQPRPSRGAPPPPAGTERQHTHNTRAKPQAYPCRTAAAPEDGKTEGRRGARGSLSLASARPRAARRGGRKARRLASSPSLAPAGGHSLSPPYDVQRTDGRRPLPRPLAGARLVGLGRLERPTSRLSGVRSDRLSYRPGGRRHPGTAAGARRPRRPSSAGGWMDGFGRSRGRPTARARRPGKGRADGGGAARFAPSPSRGAARPRGGRP